MANSSAPDTSTTAEMLSVSTGSISSSNNFQPATNISRLNHFKPATDFLASFDAQAKCRNRRKVTVSVLHNMGSFGLSYVKRISRLLLHAADTVLCNCPRRTFPAQRVAPIPYEHPITEEEQRDSI